MQMVSHKPRHRATCIDLLHSYLVNLPLQGISPPATAAAPMEARQPLNAGLPLSAVWLAAAAVSVVQQVSFHRRTLSLPDDKSASTRPVVGLTGTYMITISSCRLE